MPSPIEALPRQAEQSEQLNKVIAEELAILEEGEGAEADANG